MRETTKGAQESPYIYVCACDSIFNDCIMSFVVARLVCKEVKMILIWSSFFVR